MLYALDTLCPWAMVPIKRLLQFWYPTPFSKQVFTRFVCCFTRNTLSTFFWFDLTDYCKRIMHSRQCKFFLSTYCWSVLILLFCVYMFLRAPFHSSCLNICITSYLASYQIMWHNKSIRASYGHGLKLTKCCCFFVFLGNQVRGWY